MRIVFFGSPTFALHGLKALISNPNWSVKAIVTQPDKPTGRGGKVSQVPVKEFADSVGITTLQPTSIKKNLDGFLDSLKSIGEFDVGVVIAFGQILPEVVLNFPRMGCVNVHASLLPRWRGAAPIQRSIMAGDQETGICLMKMDKGLDTGPVYSTAKTPIESSDTGGSVHDRLAALGAELLTKDLQKIVDGEIIAVPQVCEGITYAEKLSSEDSIIEWNQNAVEIDRKIRALNPFPGTVTFLNDKRLKIFSASVKSDRNYVNSEAGEVVLAERDVLEIKCGLGTLAIHELQLEGKKRMGTGEFLRGTRVLVGTKLK